ncbi:MAG TPA: hypothetical protein DHM90_02515, partial [Clostridiaceae bacterium]|nr:hypothetical protein [Clostridiaceae bacterium]
MNIKTLKKVWFIPGVLMAGVIILMVYLTQPSFRMTMDVNPSIEIVTNRLERVVEVNPLNEDAEKMLSGYVVNDSSLENTLNGLVDRMILEGYIHGGDDNLVMISVKDDDSDSELVNKINESIRAYLENKKIEATLLSSGMGDFDDDMTGRERMIRRMSDLGVSLSDEELSRMTLKELFDYSRAADISEESLFRVVSGYMASGNTRGEGMLTEEEARAIALERVPGEIIRMEIDDDDEYEVKILLDGVRYELEIDAFTGEVREADQDDDDFTAETGTNPGISLEEARRIALEKVSGTIIEEERDDDSYDFEIVLDGRKYEIEINAATGAVEKYETDQDDDDRDSGRHKKEDKNKNRKHQKSSARLTIEEARRIALGRVSGRITEEER